MIGLALAFVRATSSNARTHDLGEVLLSFADSDSERTVTISNQTGGLLLVPSSPGWYLHAEDPEAAYADKQSLMGITDFCLLPQDAHLVTRWSREWPLYADFPQWRLNAEAEAFARKYKVAVLSIRKARL